MQKKIYSRACVGCIYMGWVGWYGCCNYLLMTGKCNTNEKRLIDANALMAEVNRTAEITKRRREQFSLRNLIMCIKNAPTVDAVEVVRCKDCRHYGRIKGLLGLRCDLQGEQIWCKDDFCSYGERREGE